MKETMIIHSDFMEPIEALTGEQTKMLMSAVMRYAFCGEEIPITDQSVSILFMLMRGQIDRMAEKYDAKCRRNQENGARGGRPKETERLSEEPEETERLSEKPNGFEKNRTVKTETLSDRDRDSDSKRDSERKELKLRKRAALPPSLDDPEVEKALNDFRTMRKEIKKPMTVRAEELLIKELDKLSAGDPIRAVDILNQSIERSWAGVFPLKRENEQKTINWEAI